MTHKKPPSISWQSYTEQQILEAQAEGKFDNLLDMGRPLPLLDEPYDELWWIRQKARCEDLPLLPQSLAIRLDVQQTLERIAALASETAVRDEIERLNERIRKAHYSASGPPSTTMPLDVEDIVASWRERQIKAL
jgi:hypothetical protein